MEINLPPPFNQTTNIRVKSKNYWTLFSPSFALLLLRKTYRRIKEAIK